MTIGIAPPLEAPAEELAHRTRLTERQAAVLYADRELDMGDDELAELIGRRVSRIESIRADIRELRHDLRREHQDLLETLEEIGEY